MKNQLLTVGFMGALTFVAISIVSIVHLATGEMVRTNETLYLKRAVMAAAGRVVPRPAPEVEEWYAACVVPVANGEETATLYRVRDEHARGEVGTVLVRTGPGLWGTITAVVGLKSDGKMLTGVAFVQHNETPGLGARISEEWFGAQFKGRRGPFRLVPEGTRSAVPQEIDAITGATITSQAVRDILNRTLKEAGIPSLSPGEREGARATRQTPTWIGD